MIGMKMTGGRTSRSTFFISKLIVVLSLKHSSVLEILVFLTTHKAFSIFNFVIFLIAYKRNAALGQLINIENDYVYLFV